MNFYFNYFSFIGREGNLIVSVSVSTLAYCLFLKKLTFPTEFVDSFLKKLTLSPTSGAKKMLASCLALGERGGAVMCQLGKNEMRFMLQNIPKNIVVAGRIVRQKVMASLARCKQDTTHCI